MKRIDEHWIIKKAVFVLIILLLPFVDSIVLNDRQHYTRAAVALSPNFHYIFKKIHQQDRDIDFLFLGASGLWMAVNARQLQDQLSSLTQTEIRVENFCHSYTGLDTDYFILKDVLKTTKVTNLFLEMPPTAQMNPHRLARYLWASPFDLVTDSFDIFSQIYSEKVLESPSSIFHALKREKMVSTKPFDETQGSFLRKKGYNALEDQIVTTQKFEKATLPAQQLRLRDFMINIEDGKTSITGKFSDYQNFFLKKIIALAEKHEINLYFIVSPTLASSSDLSKLQIMVSNNPVTNQKLNYFGYPVSQILNGLSLKEMRKFFHNQTHTNINGAQVFTETLLTPLREIYEKNKTI